MRDGVSTRATPQLGVFALGVQRFGVFTVVGDEQHRLAIDGELAERVEQARTKTGVKRHKSPGMEPCCGWRCPSSRRQRYGLNCGNGSERSGDR